MTLLNSVIWIVVALVFGMPLAGIVVQLCQLVSGFQPLVSGNASQLLNNHRVAFEKCSVSYLVGESPDAGRSPHFLPPAELANVGITGVFIDHRLVFFLIGSLPPDPIRQLVYSEKGNGALPPAWQAILKDSNSSAGIRVVKIDEHWFYVEEY
jgi:hypothetical protein